MSNKRPNVLEHVRREEEYMENSKNNDPPDPVRKATAAQLAARKIKAPKSRRIQSSGMGDSSSGISSAPNPFSFGLSTSAGTDNSTSNFNFGQQSTQSVPSFGNTTPNSYNFGQSTPAAGGFGGPATSTNGSNVFGFQPQQTQPSSPGIGAFGSGTPSQAPASNDASNMFNFQPQPSTPSGGAFGSGAQLFGNTNAKATPAASPASNNMFASQSFPSFGANNNNNTGPSTPSNLFTSSSFPPPSGGNTATGAVTSATPNSAFAFGSGNKDNASASTSTPFPFGGGNNDTTCAPASTPNNAFAFGSGNKDNISASTSTPFSFGGGNKDTTSAPPATPFSFGSSRRDAAPATTSTPFSFGGGNKDTTSFATPTTSNIFSLGTGAKDTAPATSPASSNLFTKPSTSTFANIMKEVGAADTTTASNPFGNAAPQTVPSPQKDTGSASAPVPSDSVANVRTFGNGNESSSATNPSVPAFGSDTATPSPSTPSNIFSKSAMPAFGNNTNNTSSAASQNPFAKSTFSTFGTNQPNVGSTLFNTGQAAPQPASAPPTDSINTTSAPQGNIFTNFAQSQPVSQNAASGGVGTAVQNPTNNVGFAQSQPASNQPQSPFGAPFQTNGFDFSHSQSANAPINEQLNAPEQATDGSSLRAQAQEVLDAKAAVEEGYAQAQADLVRKESQLDQQKEEAVNYFRRSVQELEAKSEQIQIHELDIESKRRQVEHEHQVGREQLEAAYQTILSAQQKQQEDHLRDLHEIEAKHEELRLAEERFTSAIARKPSTDRWTQTDEVLKPLPNQEAQSDTSITPRPTTSEAPRASSTTAASTIPPIPRAYIPQTWKDMRPNITNIDSNLSEVDQKIVRLAAELTMVNRAFKGKLANTDEYADWSALSRWHLKESKEIMQKFNEAKKERARLNGITGTESALSSKRKATEDTEQIGQTSTPKKARSFAPSQESAVSYTPKADPPAMNTMQASAPFSFTPNPTPAAKDTSQTSNLFGNILNKPSDSPLFPTAPIPDSSKSGLSAFSTSSAKGDASSFGSGQSVAAFGSSNAQNDSGAKSSAAASATGFKPSIAKDNSTPSGFKASFGGGGTAAGSSMMNAFAQKAKSFEQLAAENKAKAMEQDYDSEEETAEEWSARYDKEQAAKKEAEEKNSQGFKGFSLSTAASTASSPFNASRNASGGTSLFTSGAASPAHSAAGGLSVFDTPSAAPSPGSNIFGHLSSNASSNNPDESDEEGQEKDEEEHHGSEGAGEPEDEHASDSAHKTAESTEKKDDTRASKPSLMSRITFGAPSEESSNANEATETPQNKFKFFDFTNAGSKTAPAKPSTFAGDQTFKPGTPIKFGTSTTESDNTNKPLFNFQPATPSSTDATAKPGPFSFLSNSAGPSSKPSFLAPSAGQSGPGSVASSVFSSRATTPLSDAAVSDKDSAAQEGNDEKGASGPQLDLSDLTDEEKKNYEVLFHSKQAIAKQQTGSGKDKTWKSFARAPLWILKNRETGKAIVRMRLPSGATPVNFNILPKIASSVAGNSKTMILTSRPDPNGKISSVYFIVKTASEAAEFSSVFNANMPAA